MDGMPTGTITVNNFQKAYDNDAWMSNKVAFQASDGTTTTNWFNGYITGIAPTYEDRGNQMVQFTVASYFDRLSKKPINTEKYGAYNSAYPTSINGQALLDEILATYCSYPYSLFDFSACAAQPFEKICISENSVSEAIKKIGQAALREIYVNESGKLVAATYKVLGDAAHAIPREHVIKASLTIDDEAAFSRVRVRGRYTEYDFNSDVQTVNIGYQNFNANSFPVVNFALTPIFDINNLNALKIQNASVTAPTEPNFIEGYLANPTLNGVNWFADLYLKVDGPLASTGIKNLTVTIGLGNMVSQDRTASLFQTPVKSTLSKSFSVAQSFLPVSAKVAGRAGSGFRSLKSPDEPENNRLDLVVEDTALFNKYGVLWEEIDNPYIPTLQRCQDVGERLLQELKQSRRRWKIDLAYYPHIRLNQRVSIPLIDTNKVLQGVVRTIEINYAIQDQSESLLMSAEIDELAITTT